jgi:NAD(P)H-hydrate epimerase
MISNRGWSLVSAAEMRALDRHSISTLRVPGEVLMESAGRAVADRVLATLARGNRAQAQVGVICGVGNNGGDGFVVARQLHLLGIDVFVVSIGDEGRLPEDAANNHRRMLALEIPLQESDWVVPPGGVVVDALFGTGLTRPLEGSVGEAVLRINDAREAGATVISVDLPSGLDADTGQVMGVAVQADETVTIGLPKLGLCLEPGRSHAGRIHVARIGSADEAPDCVPSAVLWTRASCAAHLPERPAAGHKGSFGHVLLVAGSRGKTGAAHLAALGAARAGAGLVTLACPAGVAEILEIKTTEAMTAAVPDTEDHHFAAAAISRLVSLAGERDVVAIGPGVGQNPETAGLMCELAKLIEQPLIVDADGLNAFAGEPGLTSILKSRSAATVLTPHPGEAARLLGVTSPEINRDRVSAARKLAAATGSVVLLKGAGTVVSAPDGQLAINPTGGPELSAGGTGDVLTGLLAAFMAQGLPAWEAAVLAAWVHGDAGDRLSRRAGHSGLLASELADEVPMTCESLRSDWRASAEVADGELEARRDERGFSFLLPFPGA